jgi:hypothetical protein
MSKLTRGGFGVLVLAAIGCSDQSNAHQSTQDPGARSPRAGDVLVRKADHLSNGLVSVDESALHADVHDRTLRLAIPVQADKGGVGSLSAALISVDGKSTVSVGEVSYAISEGQKTELTTELALPDDLQAQADRVRYSVQVFDRAHATLQVTRSLLYVVPPYELRLEGPSNLRTQKQASYRVRAIDPISHADAADAPITLQLTRDGQAPQTFTGMTDSGGSAVFELAVDEPGDYTAIASTQNQSAPLSVQAPVKVEAQAQKLLITSDKPIYQPGQTMHLRALALQSPDNQPQTDVDVLFEVLDAKGNKVLKKTLKSDDYGITATDFQLASLVNMGDFKLRASIGDTTSEKTVSVARYVLPKFAINVSTDKPWYSPGSTISGSVDGRYFFGKNVSQADVDIQALTLDAGSNVFAHVMGKTDDVGHFTFSVALPSVLVGLPIQNNQALVTLRVQLTDAAGQSVSKDVALTVAGDAVQISLVPEATALIPGISNRLLLFANDPLGAPIAGAEVALDGDDSGPHQTDAYGTATLQLDGSYAGASVTVTLTPAGGMPIQRHFTFDAQSGGAHVLVRTDKAVYHVGDSVSVQLTASEQSGHAYVDWQNAGQSFDMRTLDLDHGTASFQMILDETLLGENRIDAYIVDADGNSIRSGRTILVNREGGLTVSLSQDKPQYKPGETAQLTLSVANERGEPMAAALGVQIVDEAVFGLIDAQPGLLRTYFELEDDFAKPSYELQVPAVNFENLLFEKIDSTSQPERDAAQVMAEAQFSARGGMQMFGVAQSSWADALQQAKAQLETTRSAEQARLADAYKVIFKSAVDSLAAEGCNAGSYYCNNNYQKTYTQVLADRALAVPAALNDYWGNPYTATWNDGYPGGLSVVSPGPDEKPYNDDDFTLMISALELELPAPNFAGGFGAAGAAAFAAPPAAAPNVGTVATAASPTASAANGGAAPEPRVRTSFPETLYTNPALITDGTGKVTIPVELADSITSWRVSSLANTRDGKLGGGQAGVTVFQDFFVDIDFPATLTRGDQVQFPVVVYNYLNSAQSVTIALDAGAWFTAQGSLTQTLQLSPNEVRSVFVPVTVTKVGQQTLTVRATGTNVSDAVQRSVRVEADGTAVPAAQSGGLENGSVSLSQSFPNNAIDGSQQLYVDLYPAFQSQAVQGLDNMLQVPSGCFEQTTSTTWPDVLVSRYLEQNHQTTPELQLKADSLISAGYQRLLTFEHSSGGFSWFGEQDPQANVSVTAFGVMEFADMAKVHDVDPAMIERTQRWLAQQQASDGSWMGAQTESFSFQTSTARNTAFVVWALGQSGYSGAGLSSGLDYVASHLDADADAYTLALAANAYAAVAPSDPQLETIFTRLDKLKIDHDNMTSWDIGNSQTDFYSSGQDADVTTTALVVHAALSANRAAATYKGALDSITHAKDVNGNFGSTQASIWALKALLLAAAQSGDGAVGTLGVTVDGQSAQSVSLQKDAWEVTTRVDLSQFAKSGSHNIALDFAGSGQLSYNLVSNYNVPWTTPPATGPLAIAVSYDRASLAVNDSVTATVSVSNRTDNTQNMLLVSVGIPPGFDLLTDDLDRQIAAGALSRYEHTGKQLILYVTSLPAQGTLALQYKLQASMPVTAADGGGQVYLYYQPDQRALASSTLLTVGG